MRSAVPSATGAIASAQRQRPRAARSRCRAWPGGTCSAGRPPGRPLLPRFLAACALAAACFAAAPWHGCARWFGDRSVAASPRAQPNRRRGRRAPSGRAVDLAARRAAGAASTRRMRAGRARRAPSSLDDSGDRSSPSSPSVADVVNDDRDLAPAIVGGARRPPHPRSPVVAQHPLDRAERHLEPARDDDVVAAAGHAQARRRPSVPASAVRNQRAPSAIDEALGGQLRVAEVALGERRSAEPTSPSSTRTVVVPIGTPS